MIIQCPACGSRAKIPDSKEGAKVRCGECGRVYVAGARGRTSARDQNRTGLRIALVAGAVLALFLIFVLVQKQGRDPALARDTTTAKAPAPPEEPAKTDFSWDGPVVKVARDLHLAAHAQDASRVRSLLAGPELYAWKHVQAAEEAARAQAEEAGDDPDVAAEDAATALDESTLAAEYRALPVLERQKLLDGWVDELIHGDGKELVADWTPYSGRTVSDEIASDEDGRAVVHVEVRPAEGDSVENRTVEWGLVRTNGHWLACRWERFLTEAEKKAALRDRILAHRGLKGVEKVELTDGSVVLERKPEPLGHLDTTPPDLRKRIDDRIATMLDLNLTKEASAARQDLVSIGKPAIPRLLTKLYEIPLDTEDQSIQVNMVVQALRDITGQYFGYEPQELVGSATGTSKERRESAIRQWFAWWYRNQDKFTVKEQKDLLDDMIQLTEEDRRWLERHKDK